MKRRQHHLILLCIAIYCLFLAFVRISQAETPSRRQLPGKIVFQAEHDGDWEIYAINADGTHLVQLTNNRFADEHPCWSPDGTQIAFTSNREGHYEIYTMNADGTGAKRLTHQTSDAKEPDWSPDKTHIVFTSYSRLRNEGHLYIMKRDGTDVRKLSEIQGYSTQPRWSPDGKKITFSSMQYNLDWGIHTFDVKNNRIERLTGSGSSRPAWSPDNSRIVYLTERRYTPSSIAITTLSDHNAQTVFSSENIGTRSLLAWSPDSRYIIYPRTQNIETPNWQLIAMELASKQVSEIAKHPVQGLWPDWVSGKISDEIFTQRGIPWRLKYVYESEYSLSAAGGMREDADALNGKAILGMAGDQAGFMAYGPYKEFPAGDYTVGFRLKTPAAEKKETPVVRIEAVAVKNGTQLAERTLYGDDFSGKKRYQTFELAYSLDRPQELELRVFFFAKATVLLDRITLSATVQDSR